MGVTARARAIALLVVLLALAGASGCASGGGLRRVAVAADQSIAAVERVQLAADQLEAAKVLTKAQRDSLSPGILRIAEAHGILARAIRASDAGTVRAQVVAILTALDELQSKGVVTLPAEARGPMTVAIEATRAVVLVISTGV